MRIRVLNLSADIEVENDIPLPELICELVKACGKSPYDINNGDCDSFADALYRAAEQMGLYVECFDSYDEVGLPVHYWVCIEGKHYDAEAPEGVGEWRELPIFRNHFLKRAKSAIS
jgi:hypothetical protein